MIMKNCRLPTPPILQGIGWLSIEGSNFIASLSWGREDKVIRAVLPTPHTPGDDFHQAMGDVHQLKITVSDAFFEIYANNLYIIPSIQI